MPWKGISEFLWENGKDLGRSEGQMIEIFGTAKKNYSRWENAKWKIYPEMGNLEWNVFEQSSRKKI